MTQLTNLSVVILSGGLATRMNNKPKAFIKIAGKRLIESTLEQIKPYSSDIIISANEHIEEYEKYSEQVLSDYFSGHLGPLAGIYTALIKISNEYLLVVPCDCPKLPDNLIERLYQSVNGKDKMVSVASDGKHLQPTFTIIHKSLHHQLKTYIESGGRKLSSWLIDSNAVKVTFSNDFPNFYNINSQNDLEYYRHKTLD